MLKFSKNDEIDIDKYEEHIRYNGYIVYDREKMELACKYETANYMSLCALATDVMIHNSGWRYKIINTESVLNYLIEYEYCPEHYFKKRGVQGYSLDSKKVLAKLRNNGHAVEFIDLYTAYKSKKSRCGKISNMLERNTIPAGANKDGIPVSKITYSVSQQRNMRYNYSDEDIIAIPKEYNSCITVEDGYFLAWGDFAQSDFRIAYNLFIRSPENDNIMNQYEDKYEALARIVANAEGKQFNLEQFKADRDLYKRLTLATVYGTRNSIVPEESAFITKFYEFLKKCPKYVEYERRLYERVKLNVPIIVQSYFGHTESCPIMYKADDTVHNALNAPVQSCTSEVVVMTTNRILDMFYELGYTEDDISVYYVRHDEPVFKIKEKVLKDIWVLNQVSEILVDNLTPLSMTFNFGYYYKESDIELEKEASIIYENNINKIKKYKIGTEIDVEYYPVPDICTLSCAKYQVTEDKTVITLYDNLTNKVAYYLCNSVSDEVIFDFVKQSIAEKEDYIFSKGYRGIHIISNFMEGEFLCNRSMIKFSREDNGNTINVNKFCRYMAYRYCVKNKIDTDLLPPYKEDEELITTAKELF